MLGARHRLKHTGIMFFENLGRAVAASRPPGFGVAFNYHALIKIITNKIYEPFLKKYYKRNYYNMKIVVSIALKKMNKRNF